MPTVLGALLAVMSIVVIAYPFLKSGRYQLVTESFVNREKLRMERQRIYRKISDLEADHSSGDLTESDFQAQRDQLRISAAEVLKQESITAPAVRNDKLEQEIAKLRKKKARSSKS